MAVGGVLVRDTDGTVTQTGPDTSGKVLTSNGAGAVPTFQSRVDYVVMSDGANPANPMNDGNGNFLYMTYTP